MTRSPVLPRTSSGAPTLRLERRLLREGRAFVAGVDEVGRGALSGPVTIGIVVVGVSTRTAPAGVKDSKLLTPTTRERLAPRLRRWAVSSAVGHASPAEIDEVGIMAAMRRAGRRALTQLEVRPDLLILDGNHDYLSAPAQAELFAAEEDDVPPVLTKIKADLTCASVAAASVLAKTTRDGEMVRLGESFPDYGWAENKGYSAPEHLAALSRLGPCEHHRRSWRLPGVLAVDAVGVR